MPDNRGLRPSILWGAGFANTLYFWNFLDNPRSYSQPRDGSEFIQTQGGIEDAWVTGTDGMLEADARWIPQATGTTERGTPVTGWDGAAGFDAFLTWARAKNVLRFCPDATQPGTYLTCYLVEPMKGSPEPEPNRRYRKVHLILRTTDGSAFTGY